MGSQYPWPQSRDCSLGVCSIYCPQWCYKIFAPPPRFDFGGNGSVETSSSGINFSPLIIALIGIAASAFILITYYTIISKYCVRRGGNSTTTTTTTTNASLPNNSASSEPNNTGLEDFLIKSIAVHKYRRNDGVVEGLDCSVCLSEFQENESLRLLPKCSHAFHVTCIDTWLKSHSSCPLCRSNISTPAIAIASVEAVPSNSVEENSIRVSTLGYQHTTNQSVLVVQDREEETYCLQNGEIYRLRRSVSLIEVLNSHEHDEDDHDLETGSSKGTASGEQISKFDNITSGVFSLVKGPLGLRRSISTGRFGFTRKCRVGMEKRLKMETNHFLKKPSKFLKPFEKIEQNQEKDEK